MGNHLLGALLLEPGLGLPSRIPGPDGRGAHRTEKWEHDSPPSSRGRRQRNRSPESQQEAWGMANPSPQWRAVPLPLHASVNPGPLPGPRVGLELQSTLWGVGGEMWVHISLHGMVSPAVTTAREASHRPFQEDPQLAPNWIPALPPTTCVTSRSPAHLVSEEGTRPHTLTRLSRE